MLGLELIFASTWIASADTSAKPVVAAAPTVSAAPPRADQPPPDLLEFLGEFGSDSGEVVDVSALENLPAAKVSDKTASPPNPPADAEASHAPR